MFTLKLYVMGDTLLAKTAIENLQDICENELKEGWELDIIDIKKNIDLADRDCIVTTPTLIKYLPKPSVRLVGDMSNRDKVLHGLGVDLFTSSSLC